MSRLASVIAGLAVGFLVVGGALARSTPEAKCAAAKNKAAAKKIDAKLTCYRKAELTATAVDSTCLSTAEAKFSLAIAKAEAAGGCTTTGDADAIESACDAAVAAIVALTQVTTTSSTTSTTLAPTCDTNAANCGSCAGGGTCLVRYSDYVADNSCLGGTGTCTCCSCVSPSCDFNHQCTSNADCAPGTTCIVVPLPTGGFGFCCPPCP